MISTELQDILFGNPVPVFGQINLGVLKKDEVNVVVHGHEPLLPEIMADVVNDPEIQEAAKAGRGKGSQPGRHVLLRQ